MELLESIEVITERSNIGVGVGVVCLGIYF